MILLKNMGMLGRTSKEEEEEVDDGGEKVEEEEERVSRGCKYVYCLRHLAGNKGRRRLLQPSSLDEPLSSCYICSSPSVLITSFQTLFFQYWNVM